MMNGIKRKYVILLAIAPLFIFIDQWTEYLIDKNFKLNTVFKVFDGFFNITYIRNTGAIFGFLSDANPSLKVPLFIFVSIIAVIIIFFLFLNIEDRKIVLPLSFSLILAGAVGNLIDRIKFGYVIDFLDFFWKDYHWPAFNIADTVITIGIFLMIIDSLFLERDNNASNSFSNR